VLKSGPSVAVAGSVALLLLSSEGFYELVSEVGWGEGGGGIPSSSTAAVIYTRGPMEVKMENWSVYGVHCSKIEAIADNGPQTAGQSTPPRGLLSESSLSQHSLIYYLIKCKC